MKLQKQPTDTTCVQTCLAMVLDVPVEDVIEEYGDKALSTIEMLVVLRMKNIDFNWLPQGALFVHGWYFIAVPSLNLRGGMHEILVHAGEDGIDKVLDPSSLETYAEDGSDLVSWADAVWFEEVE